MNVFLSYSWDSNDHKRWVASLATRLRSDGVNAVLDKWELVPGDNVSEFMERSVREADFVLIICTKSYKKRADHRTGGVGYEGDIMTAESFVLNNKRKFVPLLREGAWDESAPSWLLGRFYLDFGAEEFESEYKSLIDLLHNRAEKAPPLGSLKITKSHLRKNLFMVGAGVGQKIGIVPIGNDVSGFDDLLRALVELDADPNLVENLRATGELISQLTEEHDEGESGNDLLQNFFESIEAIPRVIESNMSADEYMWFGLAKNMYELAVLFSIQESEVEIELSANARASLLNLEIIRSELRLSSPLGEALSSFVQLVKSENPDAGEIYAAANVIALSVWNS